MFAGSMVLGFTVLGFAIWLHWNETRGWPGEGSNETKLDNQYYEQRSRSRTRIHAIIALCGILIIVAGVVGPGGPVWVSAWMIVMVALMTVVLLAGLDALRTHRYHIAKLPEIRRKHFGEDE